MRLKDINAEIIFDLWMKPELSGETLGEGIGNIEPSGVGGSYILRIYGQQWNVVLRDASAGKDLNFHLKRGCAHLAEVMQVTRDGSALVKIIFFNGEIVEIGDVEIGIDEYIESTAKRNDIHFNGIEELGKLLSEKCSLRVGDKTFFVMLAGKSSDIDFDSEGDEDETNHPIAEEYRAFSIRGDRLTVPVEKKQLSRFEDIFFASKIVFRATRNKDGAVRLARGEVRFTSLPKKISAINAGEMARLTQKSDSYLKQWDEYGVIEGEMLLKRARAIGRIDYNGKPEKTVKGVKFFVPSIPDQLTENDEIEITSEEPSYLKNPDLTWEAYSEDLEKEIKAKSDNNKRNENSRDNLTSVERKAEKSLAKQKNKGQERSCERIISLSSRSIELTLLTLSHIPAAGMFLILSINGDRIQIERRMQARSAILEGRCANPLLGPLIEEGGTIPDIQRVTKLKPLTPFVKKKIFKHDPTLKQIEAIDVALNTPDIALIQGPPGTGKTTVITAILERLNEEYDKTKSVKGQILVSGFQHDAVENIVMRLSVNALPAVKFGRRSGDSEFTVDAVTEKINGSSEIQVGKNGLMILKSNLPVSK